MSKWVFRYDPYPKKDKSWNPEERLLWVKEMVSDGPFITKSRYEIMLDASNEEEARKQALEFIEIMKPSLFPDCDEIALLLSKLTGELWTWEYYIRRGDWKLASPNVFGIAVLPIFREDEAWRFVGLFNPSHSTIGSCELSVPVGTDAETISNLINDQFLPEYRQKQTNAIQRVKEQEKQYSKDCETFWNIFSPFGYVEDKFRANTCHFSFRGGDIEGQACVQSPEKVTFDTLTVPFDVAEKILEILSQQAKP